MNTSAVAVMVLFHNEDVAVKGKIVTHLRVLERNGSIQVWEKGVVLGGENTELLIRGALNKAEIVLFLATPESVGSDELWKEEVEHSVERHKREELIFIPVIVRDCHWEETVLQHFKPLPEDGIPISHWQHLDDAYKQVAITVKQYVKKIRQQKQSKHKQHGIVPPEFQEIDQIFRKMPDEKVMKHMLFADYEGKPASVAHFAIFSEMLRKIRIDMSEREEYRFYVDNLMDAKEVGNIAKAIKERADLLKIDTIELGGVCKELLDVSIRFREDFGTPDNDDRENWEKAKVRYVDPFCEAVLKIEKKLDTLSKFSANIDLSDLSPN